MIDWILKRIEEGLSNEYYRKYYKKKDAIESLYLCDSCDMVWSIAKETNYHIACYYKDLPKYGQTKKKCPHCVGKSGVGK